jgi:hypothetical protein
MNNLFQNTQNGMEFFQMTFDTYTGKLTLSQTYLVVNQTKLLPILMLVIQNLADGAVFLILVQV